MKTNLFICLLGLIGLGGCHKEIEPSQDVAALHERFHGKYKPLQSIASEAIDVNLDGKTSVDMLAEIADLATRDLQINIIPKNDHVSTPVFLFTQFWPEQYLRLRGQTIEGPVDYNPELTVNYADPVLSRPFKFNAQLTEIKLDSIQNLPADPIRNKTPESVNVVSNQQIQVVTQKQLYTRFGWKTVVITTLYERYQKTT